ncbi:MAG: hypothetical protein D6748_13415, partial [Calditrichaeota bacterium]
SSTQLPGNPIPGIINHGYWLSKRLADSLPAFFSKMNSSLSFGEKVLYYNILICHVLIVANSLDPKPPN